MAKKKDAKKTLMAHSKAKVKLLGQYLTKYLNVISNNRYTERIKIYDLFCGEGLYENGGKGSPLIILEAVQELLERNRTENRPIPTIDVHFNDRDKKKVKKLKHVVEEQNLAQKLTGDLKFTNFDYKEAVPLLQKRLKRIKKDKTKAFIFIDPYGYKDIRASDIKKLLQEKNSEVLLFLPIQFMYRFGNEGTPAALIELMSELSLPSYEYEQASSVFDYIQQLKIGFQVFLGDDYFVDSFTIQKDKNTVYCLFFFSSHIRGFEKMLEAKWDLDKEEGRGWTYETSGNLFAKESVNQLEALLLKFLTEKCRYNGEVFEFVLRSGYLPKHAQEVLKSLQIRNKLFTFEKEDKPARKGAFYLTYNNYKDHPTRIFFEIK